MVDREAHRYAQTVSTNDGQLNIEREGRGPLIVMSHGVGDSAELWAEWVPLLADNFTVVRWDQPGHGASPEVAPDAYGPDLAYDSLCSVIGDEQVVLIGHSLGGYLSCRFAIEHPDQTAALVLVATGPGFRSVDAMNAWNDDIRSQAEKAGRPAMLVGLHRDTYVMDHLAEISCPTLAIVGDRDKAFRGATEYIARKIEGTEHHVIDDAGHMVPLKRATDLAKLTHEFLTRRLA